MIETTIEAGQKSLSNAWYHFAIINTRVLWTRVVQVVICQSSADGALNLLFIYPADAHFLLSRWP